MKLYFRPLSCSLASRIAVMEANIDLEFVEVSLYGNQLMATGGDFLEISPKGKVSTLQLPDGKILTENAAILQYLADQNPVSNLAPASQSADRYGLQEGLSFVGSELHKGILYPLFQQDTPAEVKQHIYHRAPRILDQLSDLLSKHTWLTSEQFTVADAYLVWAIYLLKMSKFELSETTLEYYRHAKKRPAVEKAFAIDFELWQGQNAAA